ncbi:MAG: ComEC/Rec2 family competence protein, partial [Nitrospinales bacterium]
MVPLLSYFLAYLGGILTSLPPSRHFLFPYLLSSVITLSGFVLYTQAKKCRRVEWLLLPALFYCGWMSPGLSAPAQPDNHIWHYLNESARARVEGQVVEPPQVFQDKVAYLLQLSKIKYKGEKPVSVSGRARITLYVPVNRFHQGDLLVFNKVRLKRPRNFKNPGRFDYKRYMESLGIDVTGGVSKIASIEKAGARPLPFFTALRGDIRERNLAMIDKNLAPAEGGLLKGMVLGERHSLSDEVREAYYATGLAHLMAVSGLHIGFVAAAFGFVLYPLMFYFLSKYFPRATRAGYARKITVLLTFLPVMFYMFVIGDKISALRAGIMVMLVLTAILVNRTKNLFNALLIAAFLILVWKPQSILDVSFQLSFAAVLSILIAIYFFGKQQGDAVDRMGEIHWTRRLPRILILISLA